jgi:hypothetical protein
MWRLIQILELLGSLYKIYDKNHILFNFRIENYFMHRELRTMCSNIIMRVYTLIEHGDHFCGTTLFYDNISVCNRPKICEIVDDTFIHLSGLICKMKKNHF